MFALAKQFVKHAEDLLAPPPEHTPLRPRHGWRVVHVTKAGPGDLLGLQSLFDYIIGVNDVPAEPLPGEDVADVASAHTRVRSLDVIASGQCRSLTVWSGKGQVARTLEVPSPEQLQVTVQWASLDAADYVWHVLDVQQDSPAHQAGLVPYSDYIVAGEDLLGRVVAAAHASAPARPLTLYVYNHDYDVVRPVAILPRVGWGGNGLLECNVGYGYLHQIPARPSRTGSLAPGEVLWTGVADVNSAELFVPAALGSAKPAKHKERARARVQDYQEYFADEAKRMVNS